MKKNDANTYASWTVDYLKYDNCNNEGIPEQTRYPIMRDALNATGRPIFFSMCEWGVANPATWAPAVGNSWRTTGDISDSYDSMLGNLEINNFAYLYAGPGGWNDPDMLEVGNGGMSTDEYTSHFSLWALIKSPLLIGCDLTKVSSADLAILLNTEVIAVNQDPLGVQGRRIWSNSGEYSMLVEACDPSRPDQRWRYDSSHHKIVSETGRCLDIANCGAGFIGNAATMTPCGSLSCGSNETQQWFPQTDGTIHSGISGQCLDVYDFTGPVVQAYPCNGGTNQHWVINSTDSTIRVSDGRCLTYAPEIPAGMQEVWAGPLVNDAVAVILFNRGGTTTQEITVDFAMAGIKTPAAVRDLWLHQEMGIFNNSYTAAVPSHGVVMLKVY